jgi:hypothetical protein
VQAYSDVDPKRRLRVMEAIRKINGQDQGLWRKWFRYSLFSAPAALSGAFLAHAGVVRWPRGAWPRVTQQTPSVAVQFFLYRIYEQMLARAYPDDA